MPHSCKTWSFRLSVRSLLAAPTLLAAPLFLTALCLASPALAQGSGPRVILDSSPPGATVYVDGKERGVQGYSSSTFKIRLTRGQHRVLLELEGYKPAEQVINITQAQKFSFTLERAPARLEVKSPGTNDSARDGDVFIDGAIAGKVPVPIEVPSGRHLVEVRKPGYRVYSENLELRAGDARTLWVTLQSEIKSGAMLVGADAGSADVFVDGQPRGPAPVLVDNLPEGEHQVEVRRTDANAPPWRETIRVLAGQQIKVMARLQGTGTGSLLVVSDTDGADVVVDGTIRGKVNQEISGLRPGQHVIDVRAKGFGAVNRVVEVEAGKQRVEKAEMPQSAEGRGMSVLRVIMMNPVEGAQYYINGRRYNESDILTEKGMEVASGMNIVVVRKEGFGEVRRELNLRPGTVETVSIDLRNVGKIFVNSEPRGAQVMIDKAPMGQTPYTALDVPAGPHMVELSMPGHQPYLEQVVVRGGEQSTVSAPLMVPLVAGPPPFEPEMRRGLSSFSALTLDPGRFTVDFGAGYPYFLDGRITVGVLPPPPVGGRWRVGFDAGVEVRTTFYETDINANLRAQLVRAGPIAIGANILIGGGGGPRKRNGFVFEAGVPITLIGGNLIRLTARPYLQVYSDRLCPSQSDIQALVQQQDLAGIMALATPEQQNDRCAGGGDTLNPTSAPYINAIAAAAGYNTTTMTLGSPTYDPTNKNFQVDGTAVLDRFNGVRFMAQAVLEVAVTRDTNIWALIEGAPFQGERQAYTDKFNRIFPVTDLPLYGRVGFSLKF